MKRFSVMIGVMWVAACSGGAQMGSEISTGPDEFSVMPNRALERPASLDSLPTPTPGGTNRADINPQIDAITALGGAVSAGGIPTADNAFLAHVQRFGVDQNVRAGVAQNGPSRLFGRDMTLDAYAELERFRAIGVSVPTAPPRP